jgi:hypothetical protein
VTGRSFTLEELDPEPARGDRRHPYAAAAAVGADRQGEPGPAREELLHLPWNESVLLRLGADRSADDRERERLSALILP